MKTSIKFEDVTPSSARNYLNEMEDYSIEEGRFSPTLDRINEFNGDRRVGLFLIKDEQGKVVYGRNALKLIIASGRSCEVAVGEDLQPDEHMLCQCGEDAPAEYKMVNDDILELMQDGIDGFYEDEHLETLPENVRSLVSKNRSIIEGKVMLDSAEFVYKNTIGKVEPVEMFSPVFQAIHHAGLTLVMGREKANEHFLKLASSQKMLQDIFSQMDVAV